MPEDDTDAEPSREHQKIFGKHKWRERLFSREKVPKVEAKVDTAVSDFLHGTNTNVDAPRLNTESASRWPPATELLSRHGRTQEIVPRPSSQQSGQPLQIRRQKRRTEGLVVRFADTAPEIIGEGGDDADLPARDVLKSRMHTKPIAHPAQDVHSGQDGAFRQLLQPHKGSEPPRRVSIQRVPTGFDGRKQPGDSDEHDEDTNADNVALTGVDEPQRETITETVIRTPGARKPVPSGLDKKLSQNGSSATSSRMEPRSPEEDRDSTSHKPSLLQAQAGKLNAEHQHSLKATAKPQSLRLSQSSHNTGSVPSSLMPGTPVPLLRDTPDLTAADVRPYINKRPSDSNNIVESTSKMHNNDPVDDFGIRVQHLDSVFQLSAATIQPLMDVSLVDWLRASIWWFLKGRGALESAARTRLSSSISSDNEGDDEIPQATKQAHVDLAKSWWITNKVIPDHPESNDSIQRDVKSTRDINVLQVSQLMQLHQTILMNMRTLAISTKKNRLLPSPSLLIRGADTRIWIEYPKFNPAVSAMLSGTITSTMTVASLGSSRPFLGILLGDTNRHFSFGRMFVDVSLISEDEGLGGNGFECVLSIIRERKESRVEITILSQDGKINLHVQSDKKEGLIWDDVQWKVKSHSLRICLSRDLDIAVRLSDSDFKTLWGIHNYTRQIEKEWQPQEDEEVVFDDVIKQLQHISPPRSSGSFPVEPLKRCKIRLFEKKLLITGGAGERKAHNGHRLVITTPPGIKILSSINRDIGRESPILFSYLRGEDGAPALLLKVAEGSIQSSIVMTFQDVSNRAELHSLLNGLFICDNESILGKSTLKDFTISESAVDSASPAPTLELPSDVQWQNLKIIGEDSEGGIHEVGNAIFSEHLRICVDCNYGTITDRVNVGKKA